MTRFAFERVTVKEMVEPGTNFMVSLGSSKVTLAPSLTSRANPYDLVVSTMVVLSEMMSVSLEVEAELELEAEAELDAEAEAELDAKAEAELDEEADADADADGLTLELPFSL